MQGETIFLDSQLRSSEEGAGKVRKQWKPNGNNAECNAWQCMAMLQCMAIYDTVWQRRAMYGNVWQQCKDASGRKLNEASSSFCAQQASANI